MPASIHAEQNSVSFRERLSVVIHEKTNKQTDGDFKFASVDRRVVRS
jgi:hypothetical protein